MLTGTAKAAVETANLTYTTWREDRTLRLGAGLAYYSLFAIVPLLALTAALAEWLFGAADVQTYLSERVAELGVVDADQAGETLAGELSRRSVQSTLGIIGLVSLLFAASIVFLALVDAVHVIWDVPVASGIGNTIRRRLVSFVMVLVAGGVLIAEFAVSAVTGAAQKIMPGDVKTLESLSLLLSTATSWAALIVAIALLFRFLGPVRVPWLAAVLSATATAVLLGIGTLAFSWYMRNHGGSSLTGAFGAVFVVLSWVYYETQIVLVGVQLVKVLTLRTASPPAAPIRS